MTNWHELALLAILSLISLFLSKRSKVQIACVYILIGICISNVINLSQPMWALLSAVGASIVAYLAGSEFDAQFFRANKNKILTFSVVGFVIPFAAIFALLIYYVGWDKQASIIAAIALAETSIAMVYAVITAKNYGQVGKFVFCALHITDLIVLAAITTLFMEYNLQNILIFSGLNIIPLLIILYLKSRKTNLEEFMKQYGSTLFFTLIVLLGLSTKYIKALPVLPVFMFGLYSSDLTRKYSFPKTEIRNFGFLFLIPLYFIRAGSLVKTDIILEFFGLIILLFATKIMTKILPLSLIARNYGFSVKQTGFITSLMATGLTLGIFITVFAFESGLISQTQYSILLPVILLTAIIPTIMAERIFYPFEEKEQKQLKEGEKQWA